MKVVKYLLVTILTIVLALLIAMSPSFKSPFLFQSIVIFIYCLLVYVVWPVGTDYSEVGINRLYIAMGVGAFLAGVDVLLNNDCSTYNVAVTTLCFYLGNVITSLLIMLLGGHFVYLGCTKKPNPAFKLDDESRPLI